MRALRFVFMSIRLLANVLSLSNVARLARTGAAASRLRSPAPVPTRWTWLRAPLGSGDAAPPPRDLLTAGAGLAPPPAGGCPISHSSPSGAGAQRPNAAPGPPQKVMRATGCGGEEEGAELKDGAWWPQRVVAQARATGA